jgi:hypothetical protein
MEVIHKGFDGLGIAFKAKTPKPLADILEIAKEYSDTGDKINGICGH